MAEETLDDILDEYKPLNNNFNNSLNILRKLPCSLSLDTNRFPQKYDSI